VENGPLSIRGPARTGVEEEIVEIEAYPRAGRAAPQNQLGCQLKYSTGANISGDFWILRCVARSVYRADKTRRGKRREVWRVVTHF
jgi:hypothetical protein